MAESNKEKESDPASSNVIDFTVIKLKQLVKHYKDLGQRDVALQIDECLVAYLAGDVTIIWQEGLPYVKFTDEN